MIDIVKIRATPVGAAGSALVTAASPVRIDGEIMAVHVAYTTIPATTDVIIRTKGATPPVQNILTLTNINTSGWFYPRTPTHDAVGATVLYAAGGQPVLDHFIVADLMEVAVAQGDAITDGVVVTLLIKRFN